MFPALKNNAAAGYKDPVKLELLKGAGPLEKKILPTATGIHKENRMFWYSKASIWKKKKKKKSCAVG